MGLSCPLLSLRWRCRPQINVEASEADSFGSGWIGSAHETSNPFSSLGMLSHYPRFGFSSARARLLATPFPAEAFMALELVPGALDGIRGPVSYPAAFGL